MDILATYGGASGKKEELPADQPNAEDRDLAKVPRVPVESPEFQRGNDDSPPSHWMNNVLKLPGTKEQAEQEWRAKIFNASVLVSSAASSMILKRTVDFGSLSSSFLDAFTLYLNSLMQSSWYASSPLHPTIVGFLAASVYYCMSVIIPMVRPDGDDRKEDRKNKETLTMTAYVKKSIPMS